MKGLSALVQRQGCFINFITFRTTITYIKRLLIRPNSFEDEITRIQLIFNCHTTIIL